MFRFAEKFAALFFCVLVSASSASETRQMLLVVAKDMNASTALLQRYAHRDGAWVKTGMPAKVNVGRNGLGWGTGIVHIPHSAKDPLKYEGDGRAPAGVFALGPVFGYAALQQTAMPYLQATPDLICVDDARSDAYNKMLRISPSLSFGSFEWMRRDDDLYKMGVVVRYNTAAKAGRGSCIFLHIERAPGSGTAGCTSMTPSTIGAVIRWLDPTAHPVLVQIPAASLPEVEKIFGIPSPGLLGDAQ